MYNGPVFEVREGNPSSVAIQTELELPSEAPMTLRVPWPLLFLVVLFPALTPGPLLGQTQKATGTITSFATTHSGRTGFVLSQDVDGHKEITLSFGSLLEDAVWFTQGDSLTIVTREGKKITLKDGEAVSVEYRVDERNQNVVTSVKTKSDKDSDGQSPDPDASNFFCSGVGCEALLSATSGASDVNLIMINPSDPSPTSGLRGHGATAITAQIAAIRSARAPDSSLLEKAQSGDAFSQIRVGTFYDSRGDLVEAAKWYRKSADQGEAHAQNGLGFLYQLGRGVPQSFTEAVGWYRKSVEQGNPSGQSNLAKMLVDGTGATPDFTQAADLYHKSAEQGWVWGQAMLAQMYAKGQGVPLDPVSAYQWCILALPVEQVRAAHWGCKELLESLAPKMKPEEISEAKRRSYAWFEQRSSNPNQKHWNVGPEDALGPSGFRTNEQLLTGLIGSAYAEGRVVAKDDPEALKWFQLGAERGDAPAESFLGERYHLGMGVPKDDGKAFALFKQSAGQGSAYGQHNLGGCYLQGAGVARDLSEAAKWFRKAAEQGLAISQAQLGVLYEYGHGLEKNEAEAIKWYQKAVERTDAPPIALNNLAWLYATAGNANFRDPAKALKYALKAVEVTKAENAGFLDTLGEVYYVNDDYENAIRTETKALALEPAQSSYKQNLEKYQRALQSKLQAVASGLSAGGEKVGIEQSKSPSSSDTSKDIRPNRVQSAKEVQATMLIERVAPPYPPLARQTRVQGIVKLHVIVSVDGSVEELEVISGHPLLVQSAMDAVRKWRYKPMVVNGTHVEVDTTVDVIFSLNTS